MDKGALAQNKNLSVYKEIPQTRMRFFLSMVQFGHSGYAKVSFLTYFKWIKEPGGS